jgi:hypothetical protein
MPDGSKPDTSSLPVLDHDLADDELRWIKGVQEDFRAAQAGSEGAFNPKETLRSILALPKHALAGPMDLSGDGPWRNGRNVHGRLVAGVFLKRVELHRHAASRTDQFPIYVIGEADAYSEGEGGQPILTPVTGGDHFHNAPGAPHAFLPKVGKPVGEDWEIAFIAITPRNLREDTQMVSDATKAAYRRIVGTDAPAGV